MKWLKSAFLILFALALVRADCDPTLVTPTFTTRTGLTLLQQNACNWNIATNANWSIADSSMCLQAQPNTFSAANTFNAGLVVGSGQSIKFNDASSHSISLSVPNPVTTTSFNLPTADGTSGQFLQTNGSGQWSFATPTASGISNLGVSNNGVPVSSPTVAINFVTPITVSLISGNTAQVGLSGSSVTLQGNTFNQANKLVQLDGSNRLPVADGSLLTNITFGTNYSQSFTSTNTVALFHNAGTNNIEVACYDNSSPPNAIGYNSLSLTNTSTATVSFINNQSGTCVVSSTGGGGDNLGNGTSSTNTWTGANTFSSATITTLNSTNARAATFSNANSQSIYGNFVGSTTVSAASSATVNVSGYSQYVIRIDALNNVASNETMIMRFNNDVASDYSFAFQGFLIGTSTGVFCAHNAATGVMLTGINNVENTQSTFQTCTLNLHGGHGYSKLEGTCSYSETSASDEVNVTVAGEVHQNPITSIQVFFGVYSGCAAQTDPLTGTTGTMFVWGVQ